MVQGKALPHWAASPQPVSFPVEKMKIPATEILTSYEMYTELLASG